MVKYKSIKALYNHPLSNVKINTYYTSIWFTTESGVRQGDSLSPTLFAIYINDLTKEMKQLNLGIPLNNDTICILLCADDIGIVADNEVQLQLLLNFTNTWCKNCKMKN